MDMWLTIIQSPKNFIHEHIRFWNIIRWLAFVKIKKQIAIKIMIIKSDIEKKIDDEIVKKIKNYLKSNK
jgi:hypothetical protein